MLPADLVGQSCNVRSRYYQSWDNTAQRYIPARFLGRQRNARVESKSELDRLIFTLARLRSPGQWTPAAPRGVLIYRQAKPLCIWLLAEESDLRWWSRAGALLPITAFS